MLERGFLGTGVVKNLTGYFGVLKGLADIRVVFDASKFLLNQALWAPNFVPPTIFTVLRGVGEGSWFGDGDFGEIVLNLFLDKKIRQYAGVDVTQVQKHLWEAELKALEEEHQGEVVRPRMTELTNFLTRKGRIIRRLGRKFMGTRTSPLCVCVCQGYIIDG